MTESAVFSDLLRCVGLRERLTFATGTGLVL